MAKANPLDIKVDDDTGSTEYWDAYIDGHHTFCSSHCFAKCVGLL